MFFKYFPECLIIAARSSTNPMLYNFRRLFTFVFLLSLNSLGALAQTSQPAFKVIAFYTSRNDLAHISFVREANRWFAEIASKNGFAYESTNNWNNLNTRFLSSYTVVLFLDTRPETPEQRKAFQQYMEEGGGWMGFHFAGFALNNSDFPQNWDWYHNTFLGCGEYASNTWRPTSAVLRVEDGSHPTSKALATTFKSAPSEWYKWANDLRANTDIKILLSVDASSFPLGTKADETWRSGYYPIAWTNTKYKMVYTNMGHNDMDYEGKTNRQLSSSFSSNEQNTFILNSLLWLGGK
jgi:uncharacterized protein